MFQVVPFSPEVVQKLEFSSKLLEMISAGKLNGEFSFVLRNADIPEINKKELQVVLN